jgi:hypothetical protein
MEFAVTFFQAPAASSRVASGSGRQLPFAKLLRAFRANATGTKILKVYNDAIDSENQQL